MLFFFFNSKLYEIIQNFFFSLYIPALSLSLSLSENVSVSLSAGVHLYTYSLQQNSSLIKYQQRGWLEIHPLVCLCLEWWWWSLMVAQFYLPARTFGEGLQIIPHLCSFFCFAFVCVYYVCVLNNKLHKIIGSIDIFFIALCIVWFLYSNYTFPRKREVWEFCFWKMGNMRILFLQIFLCCCLLFSVVL